MSPFRFMACKAIAISGKRLILIPGSFCVLAFQNHSSQVVVVVVDALFRWLNTDGFQQAAYMRPSFFYCLVFNLAGSISKNAAITVDLLPCRAVRAGTEFAAMQQRPLCASKEVYINLWLAFFDVAC